jgi:CubicO group peptidase (beta-lactamase class C family)
MLALVAAPATSLDAETGAGASSDLQADLLSLMEKGDIPGLAGAVLVDGEIVWMGALGTADFKTERPMTTSTVLNIGSVSKLVTSTAVLQLFQEGKIDLDEDVNQYLPFAVQHPSGFGPITVRQLLTHTSGIQDGNSYGESYACGDPAVTLEKWLRGYLVPGGTYYDRDNFLESGPGTTFEYSNVGYGLLGMVAQQVSGQEFSELTRKKIFAPLDMESTGWMLADVDSNRLATPYWVVREGVEPDSDEQALLPEGPFETGEYVPFCLYSFYNYPDGLLRTTIEDLTAFVQATIPGKSVGEPLLSQETRQQVFRNQIPEIETDGRTQGLGWRRNDTRTFGILWGHGGADPGVRAHVLHRPGDGVTVLAMSNALVVEEFRPILELLFAEGARTSLELPPVQKSDP